MKTTQQAERWRRGTERCNVTGCNDYPEAGVSVQLSTAGGRKGRTQVRAATVRLCAACLDHLAAGKLPKQLAASIAAAVRKVREA